MSGMGSRRVDVKNSSILAERRRPNDNVMIQAEVADDLAVSWRSCLLAAAVIERVDCGWKEPR
jgi:hypothetical protein